MRQIIALSLCILFLVSCTLPCNAWTITKELQNEVAVKKAAVAKSPQDPSALFDLAITYAYTNNILEGWDALRKVNELDPNFKNEAYKFYEKKVITNPSDWRLRFRLAFAYYFNSQKNKAIEQLKNVLVLDPYNVWAYGYISLIYGEMGNVDAAIEYAKKGLKVDNLVAALHLLLAEGYYKKGDSWNGFWERSTALRLKIQGY